MNISDKVKIDDSLLNPGINADKTRADSEKEKERLGAKRVAREFEALMVNEMLKSMRASTGKDKLTDGGNGEDIYRSMLDQEYAQAIAKQGGLGLSRMIEQQILDSSATGVRRHIPEVQETDK